MKIISEFDALGDIQGNLCAALGYFDGLHMGHQKILNKTKESGFTSAVITFLNQPASFIKKSKAPSRILPLEDKISLFESFGVEFLFIFKFDEVLMNMSACDFFDKFIVSFNIKKVVAGFNFNFGKNREGDSRLLEELCELHEVQSCIVEPVIYKDNVVSSSLIKKMLYNGNIKDANEMLSRPYFLKGKVIHGKRIGSSIGIPTINISVNDEVVVPKWGVYESRVEIDGEMYYSITNVGSNPTVQNGVLSVETHILGFSDEIYGKVVRVDFIDRIRNERKFNGIEELRSQINSDISLIKKKNKL